MFDISLPVLGHEVDGIRQWQAKAKLAMHKNKAKRPRSDLEELEEEATHYVAEGGDLLKRMKEQLNKSAQLTRRCKMCLTKRPPKSEKNISTLIKEGKKLRIIIPELSELQEHVDKSNQWLADLRASGIEEGDASVEELRALLTRSRSIQVDLRVYTKVLEKATVQYCLCRKGTKGFMISCEICNEWYHGECLGVQQRHVSDNFKYVCVMCQIIQSTEKSYKVATEILDKVQIDLDNLNISHPAVVSASAQATSQPNNEQDLLQQHTKSIHLWLQSYRMLLAAPLPRGLGDRLKKKKSPPTAEAAKDETAETATDDVVENETPSAKRARKSYSRKARRRAPTAKSETDKAETGTAVVDDLIDPAQREQEDAQKLEQLRKLGAYYDSALEHARRHSVPPFPAPAASALFTTCDPHAPLTVCINIKRWAGEALYYLPRPSSLTLHQLGQLLRFLDMSKTKPYWPVKTISQPIKAIHRRAVKWAESVSTAFKGGANTKMSRLNTLLAKAPSVPFKGAVEDLSSRLLTAIQDGKRYCICRGFNDGSKMICCDECDKWFHVACVKHDPTSNAEFSCPKCLLKRQKPQTHKRSHQQLMGQTSRPPLSEPAPPEKRTRKSPEDDSIAQMPALMTVTDDREEKPAAQMPKHEKPEIEAQTQKEEKTVAPAAIAAGNSSLPATVKVEAPASHKIPKPEPAAPVVAATNVPALGSAKPSVAANPVATPIKTPVHPVIAAIAPVETVDPTATVAPVNSIAPVAAVASPINTPVDAIIVPPVNAVPVQSHLVVAQSTPQSTAAPETQQTPPPPQTVPTDTQARADQLRQNLLCMQHFDQFKQHQQRQLQLQQFHQLQQLQQIHQQIQQQQLQQHMRQQQQLQQQQSEQQQELQKKKE